VTINEKEIKTDQPNESGKGSKVRENSPVPGVKELQ